MKFIPPRRWARTVKGTKRRRRRAERPVLLRLLCGGAIFVVGEKTVEK
jgi:hypothetical protein